MVSRWVGQLVGREAHCPVGRFSRDLRVTPRTRGSWSVMRLVEGRSVCRGPVGQMLVGRSVGQLVSRLVGQLVGRSVGQMLVGRLVGQLVSRLVGQLVSRSVG